MKLTVTRYARILNALAEEVKSERERADLIERFFAFLRRRKEQGKAIAIIEKAQELRDAEQGIVRLVASAARPLTADELNTIKTAAQPIFRAKEVIITPAVDPRQIGGIRLRTRDALVDGSIATQLKRLKRHLHTGGAATSSF